MEPDDYIEDHDNDIPDFRDPDAIQAGGTLENAQAMAAHESPRTTKLYDRRRRDRKTACRDTEAKPRQAPTRRG